MTVIEQEINYILDTLDPNSSAYLTGVWGLTKAEHTALLARLRTLIALRDAGR